MSFFPILSEQLHALNILSISVRYLLVILCGGLIGLERGKNQHAAGLRTHLVVCIGAASVMMLNQYLIEAYGGGDPARLGAQVISGIGFLGVGTIVVTGRNQVRGLTTAAGLWASACMGLAIGAGFYEGAILMCVSLYLVLKILHTLDERYIKRSCEIRLYLEFTSQFRIGQVFRLLREDGWTLCDYEPYAIQGERPTSALLQLRRTADKGASIADSLQHLGALEGLICIEQWN